MIDGVVLNGDTIVGIPDIDAVDSALREAGTEAWKLRAAARDTREILSEYGTHTDAGQLADDIYLAVTETLPAVMDTFTTLYDVGTFQFQYSATGMHDSINNPDRVAQQALRRYHHETAALLEQVDALAERHLDMSLSEHAPMEGYTDRFRLVKDDTPTVAGGWTGELERYTNAYQADGIDPMGGVDDVDDNGYDSF